MDKKTQVEDRGAWTVEEVAAYLGIGRSTAYAAVRRGELPTIRIGRRLLVPKSAVEQMLAGAGRAPSDEA